MPWLYKQPGSKFWYIGDRIDGRPFAKSTKLTDKKEAQKLLEAHITMRSAKAADRLNDDLYQALTGTRLPFVALKPAIAQWLEEVKASTVSRTHRKYKQVGDEFVEFLKASDKGPQLKDVTTADCFHFLSDIRQRAAAETVNQMRTILSVFFVRCVKNGLLKSNPVAGVKPFKPGRNETVKRKAYTLDQLKLIYDQAPNAFWRYMILGGFYTGYRMGDLICMRVECIDLEQDFFRVDTRKTGKTVQVPIARPLRDAILQLMTGKSGSDYLWPDQAAIYLQRGADPFSKDFHRYILVPTGLAPRRLHWRKRLKIKGPVKAQRNEVVFHCLRHSFTSALKKVGAHQSVAKALTGHSDDRTNDQYTHVEEGQMRKAIELLPSVV